MAAAAGAYSGAPDDAAFDDEARHVRIEAKMPPSVVAAMRAERKTREDAPLPGDEVALGEGVYTSLDAFAVDRWSDIHELCVATACMCLRAAVIARGCRAVRTCSACLTHPPMPRVRVHAARPRSTKAAASCGG